MAVVKTTQYSRKIKEFNSKSAKISSTSESQVKVVFKENLSTEQIVEEVTQLRSPQVIIWYFGCNGLRKAGIQFYRDFLISPILKNNSNAIFWLIDLTAWAAFKKSQCPLTSSHVCCEAIEKFSDHRIKCIRSAEIFKKMQEITHGKELDYFNKALRREFISQASKSFPDRNILIQEIFPRDCPLIFQWRYHDVSKAYSIFQYLEGCLLVDEIFIQQSMPKEFEIVFALPNDELKYYRDKENSFRKDVEFLIAKRCASANIKKCSLTINFLAFNYGAQLTDRPYNAQGEIVKDANMTYTDVVGNIQICQGD